MTMKTTEMINIEINEVKKEYNNIESIIGELAYKNGRHGLVHRELRTFDWFVSFMIFTKAEEGATDYDMQFKQEYGNFTLNNDLDAEDLLDWACLYWIYRND